MTRPNIIRADTIDLQNQGAPSAKDHSRQPNRPAALGEGPPAPHQADALKHVELELNEQHGRSPRASQDLSGKELGLLNHEDGDTYVTNEGNIQDPSSTGRNAGVNGSAEAEDDLEGDESDDDLMDKISSSPSIGDDGGYHLPLPSPKRGNFLRSNTPPPRPTSPPGTPSDILSSSPYNETPPHFPLSCPRNEQGYIGSKDHHHEGRYVGNQDTCFNTLEDDLEEEEPGRLGPQVNQEQEDYFVRSEHDDLEDSCDESLGPNDFHQLLAPADDPLLDDSFVDACDPSNDGSPVSKLSWDGDQGFHKYDDDTKDVSFVDDPRFIDSGWGGECLREIEDIDFEFVYALHTFVATVEGQANATKGDTMVLLDDSNSYWWLVRVVKDSSIGYLPAEHIETPLERLARLNKHRNLDLSQTMLGDEEEKKPINSMNPLKRAMQRRNTKTVQFTAPSYVEPSDAEYSTEEDGEGDGDYLGQDQNGAAKQDDDQRKEPEESVVVEPLRPRSQIRDVRQNGEAVDPASRNDNPSQITQAVSMRTSEESFDRSDDTTSAKSRKGTVRNTDSFFKDDTVETRKINLTPSLLRDDSKGPITTSSEANDAKLRPSLDSLEKDLTPDKGKDDKKRKEKRGMLGGMFKRKDKKSKGQEKESEDVEKTSIEASRQSPQPVESLESSTQEAKSAPQPHKQTSKLQKSPPAKLSPKSSYNLRDPAGARPSTADQQSNYIPEPSRPPPSVSEPTESMRLVPPEPDIITEDTAPALDFDPPSRAYEEPAQAESPRDGRRGIFAPIKDTLKSSPSEPKPERTRRAQNRMQLDDFDSTSSEDEPTEQALSERDSQDEPERHLAIAQDAQRNEHEEGAPTIDNEEPLREQERERLSESPIEVMPPQDDLPHPLSQSSSQSPRPTPHQPPPLIIDTSSQSQEDPSTTPTSSPELIEPPPETEEDATATREETPASTTQSPTLTWNDASLRAYLEDDSEIRDLLLVVHDKSNVKPARRDHPIIRKMYGAERGRLGEISKNLDGLLGDYLARKGKSGGR